MWLPPPLCAIPTNHHHCVRCPALSAVCVLVVGLGTAAHCGGTHAGVALCLAPGHHTHLPRCPRLSPLSSLLPPKPTLPHTHKWHCSLHTHMACFVCLVPSTHSHTGCLTAHTPSTHTGGCACAHPPALMRHHTHSAGTGVALAWLLWCCGHHHHAPCATHTHTGTGGGRHGGGWWWACGHCVAATPRHPLALPATTHATSTTTHTMACCLFGTPCHSHHHHSTPSHTHHNSHCATMVVAIGHHAVHTHPTLAPHMPHTHQGQAQAWLWLLVWHHHHAGVGHSLSSLLPFLSTNPFLSLSCMHSHPHPLINNTTIPSITCMWCVLWEWTDGWTTLWVSTPHTALLMGVLIGDTIQPFHPPSPLSLCFCPPPNHHPFPLLCPPHTTHRGERESGDGLVGVVGV